jgi:hypothetical protein
MPAAFGYEKKLNPYLWEQNMGSISASVGRNGVNRPDDVRLVQELLNRRAGASQPLLGVDGLIGPRTVAAIEAFQRNALGMAKPDGRVDPGGRTFAALDQGAATASAAETANGGLPLSGGGALLKDADLANAAEALNCEVACVKAVAEVESQGSGFLPSGRPKILFEALWFSRLTQNRYDASHPDISSPRWNKALYSKDEYARLEKAVALDRTAALQSASWGRFQIMGFNFKESGFASVEDYVQAMYESEGRQLDAFISFLKAKHLDAPLRERRWGDFAHGYNGPGYKDNRYDEKLLAAYRKYGGTH